MEKKFYNLTNPQKNIWNMEQYYKGTAVNNIGGTVHLKTQLDFSALSKAVSNVILAHDNFHIKLTKDGNNIKQIFVSLENYFVEIIDLNDMAELLLIEEKMCQTTFSMENSNLFCVKIFRLPDGTGGVISVMHHIISDSWTVGLFCKEIVQEYTNLIKNTKSDDVEYSYINYIKKEQEYLNSPCFEKDKKYWAEVFNTVPELATVPSFSSELSGQVSCVAKRQSFAISKQIMDKVSEFCKNNRISVYNFFMSIFSIYIGRVSNLDDFVIGTPILNRLDFTDKNTNGMFISTVPLHVNILNDSSFVDFSKSMARSCLSMLRHQRYPYQNILEDLRKLDSSIPNLYNVVLSYQITNTVNDEIDCDSHWVFNGTCADDLQIHMVDYNSTGLNVFYDYKTSKYDVNDIKNIHNRIENMIHQVLSNNEINVSDIEIVSPEEKSQILNDFNNWKVELPNDKNVIELFEDQVTKHPNTTAVVLDDVSLTYNELNQKANQLARYLQENGIQNNDIVGVCFNKNIEFIISILAILKCGGVYLPISVEYPKDRISYIVDNSKARIVISNKEMIYLEDKTKVVNFYNINLDSFDTSNLNMHYDNTHLCYIIYTSGSTGNPKGVMLSHKNLINFAYTFNDCFNSKFSINDSCLSLTSVSFDVSICELFVPLIFGSALVIYPEESLTNIDLLCKILEKDKITFLYLPPNILQDVSSYILENNIQTSMNKMLVGVESIKNGTLNEYFKINPNFEIVNGYGPTETTICTTFYKYVFSDNTNGVVPIGRPFANNKLLVVSKGGSLQPVLTPGELYVCGNNVSSGYLNNPELTAKSFINYKYTSEALSYRTGDTVYWDNTGLLHFIGRKDFQIKIKGHRIELSEINNALRGISGIKNSITVVKKVNNFDTLCAYLVLENKSLTVQEIKSILFDKLPSYMVPTYITFLDALPITINGKVDKKKLPDIVIEHTGTTEATTDTEIKLKKIFETMLDTDIVSIDDSLFNMGLDSLMAIKFSVAAHKVFGIYIDIKDLYKYDSIRALADFVDNQVHSNKNCLPEIQKTNAQDFYPLSSGQKRIYYACKMAGNDSIVYNTPGAILVDSKLSKEKVESAFRDIINSQSIFRTVFVIENEEVKQKILDNVDFAVESFNNTSSEIDSLVNNFATPFDLEKAPLLRVEIHYIDNNQTLLLFDSHHIIMDGTSLGLLIKSFCEIYNGNNFNTPIIEYKDYSVWENNLVNSSTINSYENYWINKLKNSELSSLNLPYDYSSSSMSYVGDKLVKELDKVFFDQTLSLARELNVSPYMLLISVLFILLYKYTGQNDILVGSPFANRFNEEMQNIMGMFVNNIVINSYIDSSVSFKEFLNMQKEQITNDLDNGIYPYDLLVKKLNIPSYTNLFDVMFTYQNTEKNNILINNTTGKILYADTNIAKFNLSFEINPNDYSFTIEYKTDLFKRNTIEGFYNHYINLLREIQNNPDITIKDISVFSKTEKEQLLYGFNDTKMDYSSDKTISELFEKQVEKTPDTTALIFEDISFTYRELNEKANQLAHYLRSNGIKNGNIVGIMLNRSPELIISMLAILKSGAAYLPIDPTYPENRINYIISDSNIDTLITSSNLNNEFIEVNNTISADLTNTDIFSNNNTENLSNINIPEDTAYVIYTSGSTGNPKGVSISHKNVNNFIATVSRKINFLGNIVSVTTFCFDIFVLESLLPLQIGQTVVLASDEEQNSPQKLNTLCMKYNVSMLQTTPSKMSLLLYDTSLEFIKNLKVVMVGGEPFPSNLLELLKSIATAKIYNMYGPTETTVWSTIKELSNTDTITIGKPIGNTQVYILDSDNNLVPIGVPGSLYIGGDGVSKGYLHKPELTSEKFINNPFIDNDVIYNTGDLARWTTDGEIICLGRSDFQVKLRGLRIELEEIENNIENFPNISKAIVCIKTDSFGRQFICAYFTATTKVSLPKLRDFLNNYLPSYMIPSYYSQLSSFTYTPNGKIDRKKLPEPVFNTSSKELIAPSTETEKKLSEIFEKLLKISPISVDDNFFEIGGDSLLALKLQIELLKLGFSIPFADIYKYNSVRQLATHMDSLNSSTNIAKILNADDFKDIDKLLNSDIQNVEISNTVVNIGNVLLTGATGFLGAHILSYIIDNSPFSVYCLIRQNSLSDTTQKLLNRLNYYFGSKYDALINKRIFVVTADIVKNKLDIDKNTEELLNKNISCVINSAANVKHYGSYETFEDINVTGVKNLVDFCNTYHKKFVQISTISVSGNSLFDLGNNKNNFAEDRYFSENDLYIGQSLENVYIRSKFFAEKLILDNVINNNLDAFILRVGNITNRSYDGKFQPNAEENAFSNRIKAFLELGVLPDYLKDIYVEFSPVDDIARAVIQSIEHINNLHVLHIYNQNHIYLSNLLNMIPNNRVQFINDSDFKNILDKKLNNEKTQYSLSFLVNDLNDSKVLTYNSSIKIKNDFSRKLLDTIGFKWSNIGKQYIYNLLKNLEV